MPCWNTVRSQTRPLYQKSLLRLWKTNFNWQQWQRASACTWRYGTREGDSVKSVELWKSTKIICKHFERFQCLNTWCTGDSLWGYWKTQCLLLELQTPQHLIICGEFGWIIRVYYSSFKPCKFNFSASKEMYFAAFPSFWILLLPPHYLPSCSLLFGEQSLTCHWGDSLHAKSLKHKHT